MIYYAVIDTNVLISAMLKQGSLPWKIIELVKSGDLVPLLNDEIISEYNEVSRRNEFGFDESFINETINALVDKSVSLERLETDELFADKNDIVFMK